MIYTLENDQAIIQIDTNKAEITSFKRKDKDIEYMWNGDPKYWSGRNPLLFPHVSSPANKIINFKGKDYKVNNHGFCRKSEFKFEEQGDDYLIFSLRDNEETLKEYPYHFELQVKYTLTGSRISIDYTVKNTDEDDLYFGFGQHPAFNCPMVEDKQFSDYFIEFEKEEEGVGKRLDLSYELFEQYPTFIINDPKSRVFTLSDGGNKVVMYTDEKYKIFALWTPHAPFVCLEPWVNNINAMDESLPFEKMKENICLRPQEIYEIGYGFELV